MQRMKGVNKGRGPKSYGTHLPNMQTSYVRCKICVFDQHWLIQVQVLWGAKIRLEIPNILLPDLQQRVKTTI